MRNSLKQTKDPKIKFTVLVFPHIFNPTRTTTSSATLPDNIITNNYNSSFVSGNLVKSLSDDHTQFLIMGKQHSSLEFDSTEKMFWDFQQIEKKTETK